MDGSGTVSLEELSSSISSDPELVAFIGRKVEGGVTNLFQSMDENKDGEISWDEFLQYVTKLEGSSDIAQGTDFDKFFGRDKSTSIDSSHSNTSTSSLKESYAQQIAMELTFFDSDMYTEYMDVNDTRVKLEPTNKLIIACDTDPMETAKSCIDERNLDPTLTPMICNEVQKAVIHACKKSIDTMMEARAEIEEQYDSLGQRILDHEPDFINAVAKIKEGQEKIANGEKEKKLTIQEPEKMSETEEVEEFLKNRSPVSLATLTSELNSLKIELQQFKERERKQKEALEDEPTDKNGHDDKPTFSRVDGDGDGRISREEWRLWADGEIAFMEKANAERMEIVRENRRLRTALTNPSDSQKEERLIQQDMDLAELEELIAQEQLVNSNLQAELKVLQMQSQQRR